MRSVFPTIPGSAPRRSRQSAWLTMTTLPRARGGGVVHGERAAEERVELEHREEVRIHQDRVERLGLDVALEDNAVPGPAGDVFQALVLRAPVEKETGRRIALLDAFDRRSSPRPRPAPRGFRKASGSRSTSLRTLKMAVLAPIARAKVTMVSIGEAGSSRKRPHRVGQVLPHEVDHSASFLSRLAAALLRPESGPLRRSFHDQVVAGAQPEAQASPARARWQLPIAIAKELQHVLAVLLPELGGEEAQEQPTGSLEREGAVHLRFPRA